MNRNRKWWKNWPLMRTDNSPLTVEKLNGPEIENLKKTFQEALSQNRFPNQPEEHLSTSNEGRKPPIN